MACAQCEVADRISSVCRSESARAVEDGSCSRSDGAADVALAAGADVGSAKAGGDSQHWQTDADEGSDEEPESSDGILELAFGRRGTGWMIGVSGHAETGNDIISAVVTGNCLNPRYRWGGSNQIGCGTMRACARTQGNRPYLTPYSVATSAFTAKYKILDVPRV